MWSKDSPAEGEFNRTVTERRQGYRDTGERYVVWRSTEKLTGIAPSGKKWSRWRRTRISTITARSDGSWLRRGWAIGGRWGSSVIVRQGDFAWPAQDPERFLPRPIDHEDYYPLLPGTHVYNEALNGSTRRCYRFADDAATLTRNMFGKTRYRKDLVKAVAAIHSDWDERHLGQVWLAREFRGLVPIDWIIEVLRNPVTRNIQIPGHLRPLLRTLDQRALRNLLSDGQAYNLWDLVREHRHVPDFVPQRRPRTWNELEQDLLNQRDRVISERTANRKPVTLPKDALRLNGGIPLLQPNGAVEDGLLVVVADHETTLHGWSSEMHNCISGYSTMMRTGARWLGGVYVGDRLVANFEINEGRRQCVQLLGKYNRPLELDLAQSVGNHLKVHGIGVSPQVLQTGHEQSMPGWPLAQADVDEWALVQAAF